MPSNQTKLNFTLLNILKCMYNFKAQSYLFYELEVNTYKPKQTQLIYIYIYI